MIRAIGKTATYLAVLCLCLLVASCEPQTSSPSVAPEDDVGGESIALPSVQPDAVTSETALRIGYRSSLPADVGPLWAHESGALKELRVNSDVNGFGPPHLLLQALKTGEVDLVTVMPLEPVLEDIRKGEANYQIYCLMCFAPKVEFDAIVVSKPEGNGKPTWEGLGAGGLGVIPSKQNSLIGQAIVKAVGANLEVRSYNPVNALLSLEGGEFKAIHVLGADVARAKAAPDKFAVLEACPASNRVFDGKLTPAGVGLVSDAWLSENSAISREVLDKLLEYSEKTRSNPEDPQLRALIAMDKYGAFGKDVAKHLAYAPLISYVDVKREHFAPLMTFLETKGVELPSLESTLEHVLNGR